MGFIFPGQSTSRSRRKQKMFFDAYKNHAHESKRRALEHHTHEKPSLVLLPTEVLQLIFVYSHNSDFPLVCRRLNLVLRNSNYLKLMMLSELFKHHEQRDVAIYNRRFVTKELLRLAVAQQLIPSEFVGSIPENVALPPYTVKKVALLEYLVDQGCYPTNPSKCAFILAENLFEHPAEPTDGINAEVYEIMLSVKNLYVSVFGEKCGSLRQRVMLLLMEYGKELEIDVEMADILLSANQYLLVEHGVLTHHIDPMHPELWEKAIYRGDHKAMNFLYGMR
ncbi:hypothetical protein V1512DRAFT_259513 [Lipomyces arxii]|uniref:uncharacterized protein n=1 Tax=Lipomyces arxii TaxID=56418 RepID=UPI0034CFE646